MRMVKTPDWPATRLKALIDRILGATGLNQAQLAALVGINPSQVSRWYNGSTRPRFETLTRLGATLRARYPDLDIGPAELAASAGYSTDETPPPQAATPEPLPADLSSIENPSPKEAAMMDYIASMQEEIRALRKRVDALDAERGQEREDHGNGGRQQRGA